MFDAVELEKRGFPSITIAHDTFEKAARLHADILNMPDIPLLIEPKPQEGTVNVQDIQAVIAKNADYILSSLMGR